ncbi:hypothetical protein QFC21_006982 [Naganishia friedmannii]|uniref:Uncharacterized protein n=1 Tax=Naganishia friedmannii TaxID=89922 RepID=A0ACC2UZS5_9TREE|nr:hypothetical protein QFC21_006982 [Naganishia friedmannii]
MPPSSLKPSGMSSTLSPGPSNSPNDTQALLNPGGRPVSTGSFRYSAASSDKHTSLGPQVTMPGVETTQATRSNEDNESQPEAPTKPSSAGSYLVLSSGTDINETPAPSRENTCSVMYLGDKNVVPNQRFEISIWNKGKPENAGQGKIKWNIAGVEVNLEVHEFLSRTDEYFKNKSLQVQYSWSWNYAFEKNSCKLLAASTTMRKKQKDETTQEAEEGEDEETTQWPVFMFFLDKELKSVKYWAEGGMVVKVTYTTEHNKTPQVAKKASKLEILGMKWKPKPPPSLTKLYNAVVRSLS